MDTTRPARAPRVLVVDDNRDAADTTALLLKLWGCQPLVAYGGAAGLEAALTQRPDVILLDIGLPGLDGLEVARRIRREPRMDTVVLVALTGHGQARDYQCAQEAGFNAYLLKPCDLEALHEIVGRVRAHQTA
jgi:CheY-like chemotaxis protein